MNATESRIADLQIGDRFRYTGRDTLWKVIEKSHSELTIRSRRSHKVIKLNRYYSEDHNATYGDRRVEIVLPNTNSVNKAEDIYRKMTSYSNYSHMNGIEKEWIIQKIAEGLEEFLQENK